jgi:GT2 family glycosyltransferase
VAVTAAITNYNSMGHVTRLLPQVRALGFDRIVVLDDASTDDSVAWLRSQPGIRLVEGRTNLGPTGNRNRLLDVDTDDTIVFLDVDMEIDGTDVVSLVETEFRQSPRVAVVAPVVLRADGRPKWSRWAYDTRHWWDDFLAALRTAVASPGHDGAVIAILRAVAGRDPLLSESFASGEVTWVFEQVFAVRADVFRELGGFDPGFRMFHEGPDYCLRARALGHHVRINAQFTARHLDLRSGTPAQRSADLLASTRYFFTKHFDIPGETTQRILGKLLGG